jgi:acetyltransferase-like isoleucine patch superfamily enzyme
MYGFKNEEQIIPDEAHEISDTAIKDGYQIEPKAIFLGGINLLRDLIIGAGAAVARGISSMDIVIGVPSKVLKYRGEQSTI